MHRLSRLKEHRERRFLTQMELSKLSSVSRASIAALEMQHRGARPNTVRKLASALKVRPEELA